MTKWIRHGDRFHALIACIVEKKRMLYLGDSSIWVTLKKMKLFFQTVSFHLKYFSHPVIMTWSSVCNGHDFISCFWQTINFWNDNVSEQKFSDTDHFGNDVKKATLRSWCINLYNFFNVNFIHAYTPLCIISIITKYEH